MSNKTETPANDDTRERLLDEAERLFAERGFKAVSVREITTAANCHLAAINYHFGSKQNLYVEVFRSRWVPRAKRIRSRLEALRENGQPPVEQVIRTLATAFWGVFESDEEIFRHRHLLAQELANPGEAFDLVVNEAMRPNFQLMFQLLRPNIPPSVTDRRLFLFILSMLAQVIFFNMARFAIGRIMEVEFDDDLMKALAEHFVDFTLHGLPFEQKEGSS
ncbi:MAG: TetR/AcrR family transcriptional regulator [Desulfarculaceae bacterium]|jgi:AcrR family transcriptional regulator